MAANRPLNGPKNGMRDRAPRPGTLLPGRNARSLIL